MIPYEIGGGDADKMRACAALPPGSVSVWSGGGEGVCFFGELIAIGMRERGSAGALVDGGIRDVAWLKAAGLPVFARYRTPIQSIGRWKVTGWDVPVTVPGATVKRVAVHPGDYILADDDGALVIPAAVTMKVLERAETMVARERVIRARLNEGMTLSAALEQFGHV
jgi:regulator of RNase E activity RraA